MKIRLLALVAITVFLLNGCASVPAPKKIVDNFQYTEEPDICFFPKDQAKWDGYQITNKNWNKLNDYLKLMFIFEATKELEKRDRVVITIKDSARTVRALDYGIAKINKDMPKVQILVIDFLNDVLKEAKMVVPRQTGVTKK